MKTRTTITIDGASYELSAEFLSHVLELAVEGGCSYWADASGEAAGDGQDNEGVRDFDLTDYVEHDSDADDDDAPLYTSATFLASKDPAQGGMLDLQGVADAIERIVGGEAEVPEAIREIISAAVEDGDPSDIDTEAADCIVQIGLFDEIVFS